MNQLLLWRDGEPCTQSYFTACKRDAGRAVPEMSDRELLTAVLGPRYATACEKLTVTYDGFRDMANASAAELIGYGCTSGAVERLAAVFEIAKRYGERAWKVGEPFLGSQDVYAHYRERLAAEMCEHFYVILLDNKHRKLREVLVSKGSLTTSIVHPRDVYAQVVRHSAAAIILLHNHPSGSPEPSKEDIEITRRLREVGELVGVRVLDHIIIGKGRYVSLVDDGYW
jgi:DNA repair protein RadC